MAGQIKNQMENLAPYLRQLGQRPQLSREQEYELSRRVRKGDGAARRLLAESNLAFVIAVARKFAGRGARLEDLVQEGNVGLMKAIEHFDAKKNVRFATYAVWWIRAYITRYLKDNRSQVRGGENERSTMADFSLDSPVSDDGDTTFLEQVEAADPDPLQLFSSKEQNGQVRQALTKVRTRIGELGWDILQDRLTQEKPQTLEEIGKRWGISRERVRQVELRTKHFLSRYLSPFNQDEENAGSSAGDAAA